MLGCAEATKNQAGGATDLTYSAVRQSGAAAFAEAKVPSCMLFVRNQNGSHNPKEDMRMEDFAAACAVVQRWAAEAAQ